MAKSVKEQTIELYDSLPMDKEERMACHDIRDKIIALNYKFFGYVAKETFVDDTSYEDKLQTALMSFLGMWWKYKWTPKYRDDLSFSVFFKPRISEEIRRFHTKVSYTQKRTACIKVANALGKPWTKVTYDDLAKADVPADQLNAAKSVLGANMPVNFEDYALFAPATEHSAIEKYVTNEYDSIDELLIQSMVQDEKALTDKDLYSMSNTYGIPFVELKSAMPKALDKLYKRLTDRY